MSDDLWAFNWKFWACVVLLTGCAESLVRKAPDVPVVLVAPCVADVPPIPASAMPAPGSNVERLAAGASADVRNLSLFAERASALLKACAEPKEVK